MTDTILPHELPMALERAPQGLEVLSLDCFDTLLWRDCHAPTDLFGELDAVSIGQRIVGEKHARKAESTLRKRSEVGLAEIYTHAMPNADASERAAAIAAELNAEARACFAFEPTVELMRTAKAAGLKVIIVSDTYLDSEQLAQLIAKAAGEEVAGLIDRVFASSEVGISKSQGLLVKALKAVRCNPQKVLHIGDNVKADFESARALNVPALHLVQFGETAKQRLRFERASEQIAGARANGIRALQPHRALMSRDEPQCVDPSEALGYTVLGPVFHAYDQWLRREAEMLKAERGGKVHWLFMLRDGHLPHIVHQASGEPESTARVEISRYTATAASLTTREAYERHVALEHGLNPSTLARQMLFTEEEITAIVGEPQSNAEKSDSALRLLVELRKGQRQKLTRRRARGFAQRLIAHVRSACDPQPGDTLMLVDLGYNGSAQNRVDTMLAQAFDVHVAGRYLLCRELSATGLDKTGLIDDRHFDPQFLEALCGNVAVLEQLATCEMGSVVDYSETGEPIRKASSVKGRQSVVRDAVQDGVVRFAKAANDPPVMRARNIYDDTAWRDAAASVLSRFMFFPQPHELDVVKSFEHDVNLGSERMVPLFDADHASAAMKRRGLFYMKGSQRMFLPAELAKSDMSTRLSLMVQKRFGMGLSYTDQAPQTVSIPAFFLNGREVMTTTVEARATHDGYFAARIPISETPYTIALQLGAGFEWIELASVSRASIETLSGEDTNDQLPQPTKVHLDQMHEHASGILECHEPSATLTILPDQATQSTQAQMLELVFRPLVERKQVQSSLARLGDALRKRNVA
ncbi:MAG: HAD family hydrolase [Erythrobacter sp.]